MAFERAYPPPLSIVSLFDTSSVSFVFLGFRVQSSGFGVQGSGLRGSGLSERVTPSPPSPFDSGLWVRGLGFRVQGSESRVQG